MAENLLFILGSPRSGTSLLCNCLINHQTSLTGSHFESQLYNLRAKRKYSMEAVLEKRYFKNMADQQELQLIYEKSDSLISFFRNFIDLQLEKENKKVFVEKSPTHIFWYREIAKDFPESRWIVIERNPSAVVHSIASTDKAWFNLGVDRLPFRLGKRKLFRYANAITLYHYYHRKLKKIKAHSRTVAVIAYNDLVLNAEKIRKELETKLNLPIDPFSPTPPQSSVSDQTGRAFHPGNIDHYKKQMPPLALWISELAFRKQRFPGSLLRLLLNIFYLYPFFLIKLLINSLQRQRT